MPNRPPTRRRSSGILSDPIDANPAQKLAQTYPIVVGIPGLAVTHRPSGFSGTLVRIESGSAEIRGRTGLERVFRLNPGAFSVEGRSVSLTKPPVDPSASRPTITASGSVSVADVPAQVAKASRIWVEGIHDAALVERVWGDDLRIEGIVVERLDGIDHLAEAVRNFRPTPAKKLGVLVDHLVEGSKESRLATSVSHPQVLVTGTPYVDVWQAIKPSVLGIDAWPEVPRDTEWKVGVCRALGWGAPQETWPRLLARVHSYADLEPPLVGAVERLIDFVTELE